MKDLIVLTACKDGEHALRGLLGRPQALGIHQVEVDFRTHPQKDPGCLNTPEVILRSQASRYRFALVLFDRDGSGAQEGAAADRLAAQVEEKLSTAGWRNRARAVVIEPELEQWVWSDSPHVDAVLGWSGKTPTLRDWLRTQGFLTERADKARPPKDAMEAALREAKKPWSSKLFEELGSKVSVDRCREDSFARLRSILRTWFPASQ